MKSGDLVNFEKVVEKFASQFQVRQEQQPGVFQRENKPSVFFRVLLGFSLLLHIYYKNAIQRNNVGWSFFSVNSEQEWSVIRLCMDPYYL